MRLGATGGGGQGAARISLRVGRGEGAEVQNLIRSSPGRRPTPIARLGWSARLRAPPWHAPEGFLLLSTWADGGVDRTIYVRKKRWSRSETFLAPPPPGRELSHPRPPQRRQRRWRHAHATLGVRALPAGRIRKPRAARVAPGCCPGRRLAQGWLQGCAWAITWGANHESWTP